MGTHLALSFGTAWSRLTHCRQDLRAHSIQHRAWAWVLSPACWRASEHWLGATCLACWARALLSLMSTWCPCSWLLQQEKEARATRCSRGRAAASGASLANVDPGAHLLRPSWKAGPLARAIPVSLTTPHQAWKWLQNRCREGAQPPSQSKVTLIQNYTRKFPTNHHWFFTVLHTQPCALRTYGWMYNT